MDFSSLNWGSPVALGIFLAGLGVFLRCLFAGVASMASERRASAASRR